MPTFWDRVSQSFGKLWGLPRMSTAHDPPVARILWALIAAAFIGSVLSWPFDYSLADLLAPLGGVIVVLGSYFAARTLRENEVAQATQMLAGDNEAVRIAGVYRLAAVAGEAPRFRPFVTVTLRAFARENENGPGARELAEAALEKLDGLGGERIAKLEPADFKTGT